MQDAAHADARGQHRTHRLDALDRQLVEFALAWCPYGGPHDEDTMPEFGMTAERFQQRWTGIVTAGLSSRLDLVDHRVVHEAARRLRISLPPTTAKHPHR